jgi:hypothetical protein
MKKYKIGIIVVAIFIIVGLVALLVLKRTKKKVEPNCETGQSTTCKIDLKDAATVEKTKTTVGSFGEKAKLNQNVYQNDKFKFKVTFSDVWSTAQVKETIPGVGSEGVIKFQLPTTDKGFDNSLATALKLIIYKKNAYTPSSPLETKLVENTDYIVTYQAWERAPLDAKLTEKEIANVAATFEFVK